MYVSLPCCKFRRTLYPPNDFLDMRRNYAAYSVFYNTFLPAIVGRSLMKKLVADKNTIDQVSTNTDEALAFMGLENGVERWDDIFTRCKGDVRPYAKGQETPEEHKSTVPTKYTVSSNPGDANTEKEGTDKRWSKDGIIRFNQLRQLIIKDRAAHPEFLLTWLAQERDLIVAGQTTSTTGEANMVDAEDDLAVLPCRKQTEVLKPAAQPENVLDSSSDQPASDSEDDDDKFGTA
jgi:hypothetical protein